MKEILINHDTVKLAPIRVTRKRRSNSGSI